MKKVIFENGLRAFLATFCLLLLGAVVVNAQSSSLSAVAVVPGISSPMVPTSPLYSVPQGNFYSTQAPGLIEAKLIGIKDELVANQNDPAVYSALLVKYKYFGKIGEYLQAGATTPNAIAAGMWIFLETAELNVPTSVQQSLKQEAIDLLS